MEDNQIKIDLVTDADKVIVFLRELADYLEECNGESEPKQFETFDGCAELDWPDK